MIARAPRTQETMAPIPDDHCDLPFMPGQDARPQFVPARPAPPAVDEAAAEAFGRPAGVQGAFAEQLNGTRQPWTIAPLPPEELAATFGRPPEFSGHLQRPPAGNGVRPAGHPDSKDDLWPGGAVDDPWRDPHASAVLGPPAVAPPGDTGEPPPPGARLSLAEVLFGGRVSTLALAALAAAALLIG